MVQEDGDGEGDGDGGSGESRKGIGSEICKLGANVSGGKHLLCDAEAREDTG